MRVFQIHENGRDSSLLTIEIINTDICDITVIVKLNSVGDSKTKEVLQIHENGRDPFLVEASNASRHLIDYTPPVGRGGILYC